MDKSKLFHRMIIEFVSVNRIIFMILAAPYSVILRQTDDSMRRVSLSAQQQSSALNVRTGRRPFKLVPHRLPQSASMHRRS